MHYLSFVPGAYFGGCEDYALRIADAALQRRWSVSMLAAAADVFRRAHEFLPGAEIHSLISPFGPEYSGPNSLSELGQVAMLKRRYSRFLVGMRPSVVHAVLPWHDHSIFFLEVCFKLGIPVLVTYQLVAPDRPPHWRHRRKIRKMCHSRLITISAISRNNRDLLSDYYNLNRSDIPVIPNRPRPATAALSAALSDYASTRKRLLIDLKIPADSVLSLTVASLCYQKGIDVLLKGAFLLRRFTNLYFLIAGDGPERSRLEALAKSLNVYGNVRFLGYRNDVDILLMIADMFVFSTRYEGESFALLEAARSSLPIVSSSASGISETFRHDKDALLFGVDDSIALSKQVARLLNCPDLGREIALSAYSRISSMDEVGMIEHTLSMLTDKSKSSRKSRLFD